MHDQGRATEAIGEVKRGSGRLLLCCTVDGIITGRGAIRGREVRGRIRQPGRSRLHLDFQGMLTRTAQSPLSFLSSQNCDINYLSASRGVDRRLLPAASLLPRSD